ncbi:MAG: glycosyltransferase [Heliobacteriaceae bacterium]|jgi:glycosyltransferase involved in cell wall biosynthesis|nr:glycosyltransferase [Heliobacteriaceae bacterium]
MKPKVSVIIPVYNVEKYLHECLDSVVNQTLREIEIICVNDGSPDGCGKILKEYVAKDKRIKIIDKPNGGYGSACNAGLDKAAGEYVAIVESDDFIAPKMYERLYTLAQEHDVDIVKSCFFENYDTPKYKKVKKIHWNKDFDLPTAPFTIYEHPEFLYFHPSIWSCIYRLNFLKENGIRFVEAGGSGWTDNPFQVQTMCLAKKIFYTNEAFYYWRNLNRSNADDLKDYTVPFKRSDEIHNRLAVQSITDKNLLNCLHRRELTYIKIVLQILKFNEIKTAKPLMAKMYSRMGKKMPSIYFAWIKAQIKKTQKRVLSIRWNRREKSVRLLGRMVYEK